MRSSLLSFILLAIPALALEQEKGHCPAQYSHSASTYDSPTPYSSIASYPSTCADKCASAILHATDGCSSLIATTIYPKTTFTSTVAVTALQNTTIFPVVSTQTDIETETFTESATTTTGTTTIETVVATDTITSIVTFTTVTGTVTLTQQPVNKRSVDLETVCTNSAQYSSACKCAGYTPITITAPTPTVTVTSLFNSKMSLEHHSYRSRY